MGGTEGKEEEVQADDHSTAITVGIRDRRPASEQKGWVCLPLPAPGVLLRHSAPSGPPRCPLGLLVPVMGPAIFGSLFAVFTSLTRTSTECWQFISFVITW